MGNFVITSVHECFSWSIKKKKGLSQVFLRLVLHGTMLISFMQVVFFFWFFKCWSMTHLLLIFCKWEVFSFTAASDNQHNKWPNKKQESYLLTFPLISKDPTGKMQTDIFTCGTSVLDKTGFEAKNQTDCQFVY